MLDDVVRDVELKDAKAALRDAESELAEAKAAARGGRLPARLTVEEARKAPVSEQRHWLSLVYAAVAVRKARVWREPVADRALLFDRDAAPSDGTGLRGFVTAQTD